MILMSMEKHTFLMSVPVMSSDQTSSSERSAIIRKTPGKNEWCVKAKSGKSMGCYNSKAKAKKRLQQVEMFKHMKRGSFMQIAARVACVECKCDPNRRMLELDAALEEEWAVNGNSPRFEELLREQEEVIEGLNANHPILVEQAKLARVLNEAAKTNPRLASMIGMGKQCPACGSLMQYDDGRDAFACPCGFVGSNSPAGE